MFILNQHFWIEICFKAQKKKKKKKEKKKKKKKKKKKFWVRMKLSQNSGLTLNFWMFQF